MDFGPTPQTKFGEEKDAVGSGFDVSLAGLLNVLPQGPPLGFVPPINSTRYNSPSWLKELDTTSVVTPATMEME